MTETWTNWENAVVNGVFPLRRVLGSSDHSGVFLTEHANSPTAAIKLIAAEPARAERQLAQWEGAAGLAHPNLLRLLDTGRCELGGAQYLFVVMDYAEQTLAQLLPHRALTAAEVGEMLAPTLDVLAFLHRKNLVLGRLRPANILVVNDQLKLAADTIRPAGYPPANTVKPSVYDPPEAGGGGTSTAGDVWSLGITVFEALTQYPTNSPDERAGGISLPVTVPPALVEMVRRCLMRNPADRPTIADLQARRAPAAVAPSGARPRPAVEPSPVSGAPPPAEPTRVSARAPSAAEQSRVSVARAPSAAAAASPTPLARPREVTPASPLPGAQQRAATSAASTRLPTQPIRAEAMAGARQPALARGPEEMRAPPDRFAAPGEPTQQRLLIPAIIALVVVSAVVWGGLRLMHGRSNAQQPAAANSQGQSSAPGSTTPGQVAQPPSAGPATAAPPSSNASPPAQTPPPRTPSRIAKQPAAGSAGTSASVRHQEIPDIPRSALNTIHGHVKVAVRVTVDSSGNVVDETLDNAGPSRYFAGKASAAARKWRFAPADGQSSRKWLLLFEFSRTGVTGQATAAHS